jgi:lipoprotein-anchoring transpeptidase ErfK/SrfK
MQLPGSLRDDTGIARKGAAVPEASRTGERSDAGQPRIRTRARFGAAVVLVLAVAVGFVGCGGGGGDSGKAKRATTSTPTSTPTATSLPEGYSLAAQAKVPQLAIYDDPGAAAPSKTVPNPWLLNEEPDKQIPQVFLVEEQRPDGWLRVLLAERPNGSTGWIRQSDVQLTPNPYRMQVKLGDHKITVFQGTNLIYEGDVAIGKPETPTPPGKYYTRVLIQAPDPNTVYGPFAYGLSAHSEVLTEFSGGDAEVGVHGNNDQSVLGKSVTAGCIRMDNDQITKLSKVLPLGTPVEIVN